VNHLTDGQARNIQRLGVHLPVDSSREFLSERSASDDRGRQTWLVGIPAGARGITVSTLKEAEAFFAAGVSDILYAVSIAPSKLPRALALRPAQLKRSYPAPARCSP